MNNIKIYATVLMMGLSSFAFATAPKGDAKTDAKTSVNTEAKATNNNTSKTEAKTNSGTAVFLFEGAPGDDVNDPSNYSLTPISDPNEECTGMTNRCAATFQLDGSGNRTGSPEEPTFSKD